MVMLRRVRCTKHDDTHLGASLECDTFERGYERGRASLADLEMQITLHEGTITRLESQLGTRDAEVARLREFVLVTLRHVHDLGVYGGKLDKRERALLGDVAAYFENALAATGAKPSASGGKWGDGTPSHIAPPNAAPGTSPRAEPSFYAEADARRAAVEAREKADRAEPVHCGMAGHECFPHVCKCPCALCTRAAPDEAERAARDWFQKWFSGEYWHPHVASLAALLRSRDDAASAETVRAVCELLKAGGWNSAVDAIRAWKKGGAK
jgi:hypothetical protein